MGVLDSSLRSSLEKAVIQARDESESAARAALRTLAVDQTTAFATLDVEQRQLRNALRARARQLGSGNQTAGFEPLVEEVAYEQWHRMLFARFLAENSLLMHPAGAPVTLDECDELAAEEGEPDRWQVAAKYASRMLPGIFRVEDPAVGVRFAPEGRVALERILSGLPAAVFTADDGLGWVYQFWQTKKKREVNASGRKIGGADLAPVTQLFTENYMVRFLLENSLGAWWAGRHPHSPLLRDFEYLRFKIDGTPAAGVFEGWPQCVAKITVMDPCCGSGHFLVVAFGMLRRMRMEEEGLSERAAADAVLRDNLFGLEIDARCVQIAAFALALAAWKVGGFRPLPQLNLACSGIPVTGQLEEWTKLAGDDANLRNTLERLYELFRQAPDLGSLIDPAHLPVRDRMFAPSLDRLAPILDEALAAERATDPIAAVFGGAAAGAARAAKLLSRQYILVSTNVPYLARGKQSESLKLHLDDRYSSAKADLSTGFVARSRGFLNQGGTFALVTPQNWLFLASYRNFRRQLLQQQTWCLVGRLGSGAFETISGEIVNIALAIVTNVDPNQREHVIGLDISGTRTAPAKREQIRTSPLQQMEQASLLAKRDASLTFDLASTSALLSDYATGHLGLSSGDYPRFGRVFWERVMPDRDWSFQQSSVDSTREWGGREHVFFWQDGRGDFYRFVCDRLGERSTAAWIRGTNFKGRRGVAIRQMNDLPVTIYTGELYDSNVAVLLPKDDQFMTAIWAFCSSDEFATTVRKYNQKLSVDPGYIVSVPFDLERWQNAAQARYPDGLPEPYSNDPTQWLFKGAPADSTEPLQVGLARLLGYHWPQQQRDELSAMADDDGIVPLMAISGEQPGAERLRRLLASAYGEAWSPAFQEQLLHQVGYGAKTLDLWLHDGFFEQHTKLFQQRPFIWHIWDGRKDGFSVLVNYHKLDGPKLDRLTYTDLGAWISTQQTERDAGQAGAEGRLVAALQLQKKLQLIREGEPPYDIYVRWKPLAQQPMGWEPDLNDGVRLNIRPFIAAGVLRSRVNVNWNKDRGRNPDGSERLNDLHRTIAAKRAAREAAGG
jgi:hypothetical protein